MENQVETAHESQTETVRRDSTKIYFFIVAIVALLATNVYFYVKYKGSGEQVTELTHEKIGLQTEIDRIEIDLNRLSAENESLNSTFRHSKDSTQRIIATLRQQLEKSNLSNDELIAARKQIDQLRSDVHRYTNEIESLKQHNTQLLSEQSKLKEEIKTSTTRVDSLTEENVQMSEKLKVASALKVSNMSIVGLRERNRGREEPETRNKRVDKFDIGFTIADNPLAETGSLPVFLRIIDPNGNLITPDGNLFFETGGKKLQYTYKTNIEFSNDGKLYNIEWRDEKSFQKGTYTVLMYSKEGIMGRSSIVLK